MKDYTGKTVFIGIDVHKKTYAVTCICEKIIVKRDTLKADGEILFNYLSKYFKGAHLKTVYEAGFSGFVLHRYLLEKGIENRVVHAASVEISARDRVKTDKRDSLKLATQLSDGRLRGIHVPEIEREACRELTRLREKLARDKRRIGNRLKSLLYRQGLIKSEDEDCVSEKWLKKIAQYVVDPSIKYMIDMCREQWLFILSQIKALDKKLSEQAKADSELEKIYGSVPGIGPVHGRVLANELGDMSQFSNEKKLFSFTGLTPSEHSSGEHRRLGHMSRQGRSILRKTLVEASWVAIEKDVQLKKIFDQISKTAGKKRAIIGIARRLLGRMRSCLKDKACYRYGQSRTEVMPPFCQTTGEIFLTAVNS